MRQIFISIVCAIILSIGSVASADPIDWYSSLTFKGIAVYATDDNDGPAFGPFYGITYAEYYGDQNLPSDPSDLSKVYDWKLTYNFRADGEWYADGVRNDIDFNVSESFNLGQFALGESGNPVTTGRTFIESLDSYAYTPGIGGYIHFGDSDHGVVLAGLSHPLGNLEKAFVEFNGDVQLTATSPVPEPATMLLFGTGLAGLAGFSFKRKKK